VIAGSTREPFRPVHPLILAALLCTACAPEAPLPPTPKPNAAAVAEKPTPVPTPALPMPVAPVAKPADILGWWERPESLSSLGLTASEGAALAAELRKLERSYQTAQRQLRQVRRTQMLMLQDPKVPSADIRRFNQRNLQFLLTSMLNDNIAARLWVRERLSAEQRARVLQRSPRFYSLRWFRAAGGAEEAPLR